MNEYIERSGISKTVLANITGVHERTIDRGCSFLIKDSEKYKILCSFLSLSKNERQELDDLYIKTQFSEDEFVIINAFNDMLLKFDTLFDIEYHPVTTEFKKQSAIEREENICAYIMNLVKSIKDKDCEVNVFMKNPVNSLVEMLSECIRHNDRIQMKLVTAFEIGDNSSRIKTSIRKLCSLMPLFRHPQNVAVKYFYTALSAVDFPFPIAVIINSDVIAIDDNCSTALHFDSSEIAHLYKKQFDKIYASSMTLVSFMNVFDCLYGNLVVASDKSVSSALQASCCIYKYLPVGLADKYVKKDLQHREKIVEMADNHVNMIRELKKI